MTFILFISFVILLRLLELMHSKSNEKWLLQNGALEYGQKHYPFIVMLHFLFFISLIVEYSTIQTTDYNLPLLVFYILILAVKAWVILSLGKYWNTKIYHISNHSLIKRGPYNFIKHPNYILVMSEIVVIPLIFHLYFTAITFSILNAIMLFIRIKVENKAMRI